MKKHLLALIAALTCTVAFASVASAQTATFSYNDGVGTPNAGSYAPGDSFTFSITLAFTAGGSITNLDGLSYWLQQSFPVGGPFYFAITLRDVTGSLFTDLQTPFLSYPQSLNPANANDLGAAIPGPPSNAVGNGSYFIADITVSISPSAPITGTYILSDVITGGKTSVISDSLGNTFAISQADYTITMVPEPATWLAGALAFAALLVFGRRRIARRQPVSI